MKQKAGNIIAAIATTNAIIAGLIVLEALKVIEGERQNCRFTYLYKEPNGAGKSFIFVVVLVLVFCSKVAC